MDVVVDSHLTMTTHVIVSAMCRAAYYQLLQLRALIRSLSFDATKLLVQAFISTRLDYCNSLLYRTSDNLYRRLQAIQHAAARLITNTRKCEHITPVLQQLAYTGFQSPTCSIQDRRAGVQSTAQLPACVDLAEDCQFVSVTGHHQRLRSSDTDTCLVQRTNARFGDRSFAVAGPRVWNSLPT